MPGLNLQTSCVLVALCAIAPLSHADVLTFDDLPAGTDFFTADYNGFRFGTNDRATTAWFHTDLVSGVFKPVSPTKFIATDLNLYSGTPFEATQSITSAVDFVFDGAFFSGFDQVRYELYNDGALVHVSADSSALNATPTFYASGYAGLVDEVLIRGTQGFYALDNFTYNSRLTVAEPGVLALVLVGALGAAATRLGPLRRAIK